MEGKALITITSDDSGKVGLSVDFFPPIKKDGDNPISHTVALEMLDTAVNNSDDPEEAFNSRKFYESE